METDLLIISNISIFHVFGITVKIFFVLWIGTFFKVHFLWYEIFQGILTAYVVMASFSMYWRHRPHDANTSLDVVCLWSVSPNFTMMDIRTSQVTWQDTIFWLYFTGVSEEDILTNKHYKNTELEKTFGFCDVALIPKLGRALTTRNWQWTACSTGTSSSATDGLFISRSFSYSKVLSTFFTNKSDSYHVQQVLLSETCGSKLNKK